MKHVLELVVKNVLEKFIGEFTDRFLCVVFCVSLATRVI